MLVKNFLHSRIPPSSSLETFDYSLFPFKFSRSLLDFSRSMYPREYVIFRKRHPLTIILENIPYIFIDFREIISSYKSVQIPKEIRFLYFYNGRFIFIYIFIGKYSYVAFVNSHGGNVDIFLVATLVFSLITFGTDGNACLITWVILCWILLICFRLLNH